MQAWMLTAAGAAAAVGALAPRLGYRALRKDPHTPVERFGFHLRETASRRRVEEIVEAFFTGYNAGLSGAGPQSVRARCRALPEVLHPFAFEGSGMGFGARGLLDWRVRAARLDEFVEAAHPGWRFMFHIGLGIWTAFLGAWQTRRVAGALPTPKYAGLLYDGYGFKCGFFHRVREAAAHRRLAAVPSAERAHAWRGFGRSLWFVFRDDHAGLLAAVEALPAEGRDAAVVGVGLAIAFTAADDLHAAVARLEALPGAWRRDLERGLRLALYVRHAGQPQALDAWIAAAGPDTARLRGHLAHAIAAHAASIDRATFLHDFTQAC